MKRWMVIIIVLLACVATQAQVGNVPPPNRYSIQFESQHGEAYCVFVDGELQNRLPQSRVIVSNVSNQTHEVVVVLRRPVEKCAVLMLQPADRTVIVNVNYDQRLERLYLYTAAHNKPSSEPPQVASQPTTVPPLAEPDRWMGEHKPDAQSERLVAEGEAVSAMVVQLKSLTFENDRLALAKVLVASAKLTAEQIARIAETLDFTNTRVDFLKYAYGYCYDPVNYYRTVDVLAFAADKKKVLDYVASQR